MFFPGCRVRDAKAGAIFRKAAVVNCGTTVCATAEVREHTGHGRELAKGRGVKFSPKFKSTAHQRREAIAPPVDSMSAKCWRAHRRRAPDPCSSPHVKLCVQRIQPEEFYEAESVECGPVDMRLGTPEAKVRQFLAAAGYDITRSGRSLLLGSSPLSFSERSFLCLIAS